MNFDTSAKIHPFRFPPGSAVGCAQPGRQKWLSGCLPPLVPFRRERAISGGSAVNEWTDDLSFQLPPDRTVAELVDVILRSAVGGEPYEEIDGLIRAEFKL